MSIKHLYLTLCCLDICFFLCPILLQGAPNEHISQIHSSFTHLLISDKCNSLYDPNQRSIQQLHASSTPWKKHTKAYVDLNQKGHYYLRFKVENIDSLPLYVQLQLSSIDVHRAKFYWIASGQTNIDSTEFNGSSIPLQERPSKSSSLHFISLLAPKKTYTCYFLLESSGIPVQSIVHLQNPLSPQIQQVTTRIRIVQGISLGIGVLYAIFGVLVMFLIRDRLYLGYAIYTFSGASYIMASYGIGMELFWGRYAYFEEISAEFFGTTMFIGLCIMSRFALNTKQRYPKLDKLIRFYEYSGLIFILIYGLRKWISASVIGLSTLIACALLFSCFILIAVLSFWDFYRHRERNGFSFLMIFAFTIIAASLLIMAIIGLIPRFHFFEFLAQIAILAEVTFATIYIIRRVKQQILDQETSIYLTQIERQKDLVRIARDLHDELGSSLSTVSILVAESVKNLSSVMEAKRLTMVGEMIYEVMDQMGDIVWSLKSYDQKLGDLIAKMREYALKTLEPKDIDVFFEVGPEVEDRQISAENLKNLYLIFKESINNSAKYSHAKTVWIVLSQEGASLILTIKDNGKGFDLASCKNGNGLGNLKSRASEIGANLQIKSQLGKGASILLNLPLAA
jgi:signal transduction histidine kinase